jgi:hypothetical protein
MNENPIAPQRKPLNQRRVEEWTKRERLLFAAIGLVAAGALWLSKYAPPSIQSYLNHLWPYAVGLLGVVGATGIGWVKLNAPEHSDDHCPFKIGDTVYFYPSDEGRSYGAMSIKTPKTGQAVKITDIVDEKYVQWERNPTGDGIHWTEFSAEP